MAGEITKTSEDYFAAGGLPALAQLIQQLLGGGTAEMRAEQIRRLEELQAVRGQRADYSKEAAFADATGAVNQQSRRALEQLLPTINAAAAGAGTSKGSMRALLTQDAANKAAESAAAKGLEASVNYGQISSNLSSILESLTRQTNPVTAALLSALQLSKSNSETQFAAPSGGSSSGGNSLAGYGVSVGSGQPKWGDPLLDGTYSRFNQPTNNTPSLSAYWGQGDTSGYGTMGDPRTSALTNPNAGPINDSWVQQFTF